MTQALYRSYFLQPSGTWQRRYETLRSYFVEEQPLTQVAQQCGVSYGTVCNWVSQFRAQCDAGQRPPFFKSDCQGQRRHHQRKQTNPTSQSPMCKRSR
jgi:hypothetical protein